MEDTSPAPTMEESPLIVFKTYTATVKVITGYPYSLPCRLIQIADRAWIVVHTVVQQISMF